MYFVYIFTALALIITSIVIYKSKYYTLSGPDVYGYLVMSALLGGLFGLFVSLFNGATVNRKYRLYITEGTIIQNYTLDAN